MKDLGRGGTKRVVVVGGGVAGSLVAKTLQDHAHVVLIDSKEYFEITWASLRSLVEPLFAERSIINHAEYLPNAEIVVSTASNITETEVLTVDGHLIAYDYLLIATGHADNDALTRSGKINHYEAGTQARLFGSEACSSSCQKLEAVDDWRRRESNGYVQAGLANGDCFTG